MGAFNAAAHFIGRHAGKGRAALVGDWGEVTYAELDQRVRRCAGWLGARGVARGDRVALVMPDGPQLSTAFWGALAAGAVAVPLNPRLGPAERAAILEECRPRLVLEEGSAGDAAAADYAATDEEDAAFILYSSGTTGAPKGVVHRMRAPLVCARAFGREALGLSADDRVYSVARMFFAYGLGASQVHVLEAGATAVLCPLRQTPEVVLEQIERHRPTVVFAVPTSYAQLLRALEGAEVPAALAGVRLWVSAGEALPPALFARWRERVGGEILDGIGTTEACNTFITNRPGRARPGSSGTLVEGYEVRIVDEHGADVPVGQTGDLLVRGGSTLLRYWGNPEATARVLDAGGWLRTGDKFRVDQDGYYFHAGRGDDLLKVGGIWVSPVEVEAVLAGHDAVLECAVVGRADADGLVKPHAVVVRRPGRDDVTADDLVSWVRDRLAHFKCPRSVSFLEALPRTATGKLRRFLLRQGAAPARGSGG